MLGLALTLLLATPASTAPFHTGEVQLAVPKNAGYDLWGYRSEWNVNYTMAGDSFWAAGANDGAPQLRFYGDGSSLRIGNPEMQPPASADEVSDLVVAGEWRTAVANPPRRRVAH